MVCIFNSFDCECGEFGGWGSGRVVLFELVLVGASGVFRGGKMLMRNISFSPRLLLPLSHRVLLRLGNILFPVICFGSFYRIFEVSVNDPVLFVTRVVGESSPFKVICAYPASYSAKCCQLFGPQSFVRGLF